MKKEIIKVQCPIMTNDPDAPWLVYAKHHRNQEAISANEVPERVKEAMRGDYKAYFEGKYDRLTGNWTIGARVGDIQDF